MKEEKIWNIGLLLQTMFNLPEACKEIRVKCHCFRPVEVESDHYVVVKGRKQINSDGTGAKTYTKKTVVGYRQVKMVLKRISK